MTSDDQFPFDGATERPDEGQQKPATTDAATADAAAAALDLRGQLAQAQAQAAEYLDNWRRSVADLSNARKRMQREQAETVANSSARVLERLLPILDDMDRAFDAVPAAQEGSDWVNGFRIIQRKLQGVIQNEGVTPIETEGQLFDPALHFAVTHEEAEGYADGQIISEVGRGYKLGDKVLRPAMVRVAKGS